MLTDAELAALESRLAPVLAAQGGRGVVDRHDVLALLAEVRRLRVPPDVAGLMPAAELARVRETAGRLANDYEPGTATAAQRLSDIRFAGNAFPALLSHTDAQAALCRELYAVVADLREDLAGRGGGAYARGRAEGRGEALRVVEKYHFAPRDVIADEIRALGPCRPPLPPCEAEARLAVALDALRQCLERLEWVTEAYDVLPAHTAHAIEAARAALGEDAG